MNPTQAEAMEALDVLDKLPGYQTAKDTLRAYLQASGEPVADGAMMKTEFELFDACWNLLEKLRGGGNMMNSDTLKEREYKAQAVLISRLVARNEYAVENKIAIGGDREAK